jgi:WD40 repeat protein
VIDVNGASFGRGLIAWSPDETRIAAVGSGKPRIVICDVAPGGRIQEFVGHSDNIGWLSWSDDGERIASSSRDRTIKQWSLAKNANHPKRYPMPRSAWSPDPHHPILASAHQRNGMITVWDVERDQFMYEFEGSDNLRHVTFSPDGRYLASSTRDFNDATSNYPRAAIGIWDLKTGRQAALIPVQGSHVYWTEWSPEGRYLAAAILGPMRADPDRFGEMIVENSRVELWDVSNLEKWEKNPSRPFKTLPATQMYPRTLAWSSNDKSLAVGHGFNNGKGDGSIHIWTIETDEVKMLHGHKASVMEIAWSPDDKSLFSCSREPRGQSAAGNECIVWDVESSQEKFRLKGHLSTGVLCVDWSPDGKRLVSGARDSSIRIWDSETGNLVSTLLGHESFVSSVQWNHDGTILASSEAFGRTILWDATKGYALDRAQSGQPVSQE